MIFNRINVSVLDRIIIKDSDTVKISKVIEKITKDDVLHDKIMTIEAPFTEKGIITYKTSAKNSPSVDFYYNLKGNDGIELNEIDKEGNISFRVYLDNQLGVKDIRRFSASAKLLSDKRIEAIAQQTVILLIDFMKYTQYMSFTKQNNPIVIKRAVVKQSSNSAPKKATNDNRTVVSVSKPKKVYDYEQAEREGDTRNYERHAESWDVVGHWRHYKNTDKRVFVKGYKKGEGTKKGKDYTV